MTLSDYKKTFLCFNVFLVSVSINLFSQKVKYTVANGHAHNDYEHPIPFYTAFNAGFGSIEADVFPVNGVLLVAHSKKELQPQRTLKDLYLIPLLKTLLLNTTRRLNLLVDIKENYKVALALLIQELEPLKQYLSIPQQGMPLTIVISGNRPPPVEYKNYPPYIFFDNDLKLPHTPGEWERVALVSLPFNKISGWKGEGDIDRKDKKRLRHTIDSVHSAGKPIRFWAAPDTEASWKLQIKLHADSIGTDKIDRLATFLQNRSKRK